MNFNLDAAWVLYGLIDLDFIILFVFIRVFKANDEKVNKRLR